MLDVPFLTWSLTDALTIDLDESLNGGTFWNGYSTHGGEDFIPSGLNSSTTKAGYINLYGLVGGLGPCLSIEFYGRGFQAALRAVPSLWDQRAHRHAIQYSRDPGRADIPRCHARVPCVLDGVCEG